MCDDPLGAAGVRPRAPKELVMRAEHHHALHWAGKPDTFSLVPAPDGSVVLGARRSFDVWLEEVRDRSTEWCSEQATVGVQMA